MILCLGITLINEGVTEQDKNIKSYVSLLFLHSDPSCVLLLTICVHQSASNSNSNSSSMLALDIDFHHSSRKEFKKLR